MILINSERIFEIKNLDKVQGDKGMFVLYVCVVGDKALSFALSYCRSHQHFKREDIDSMAVLSANMNAAAVASITSTRGVNTVKYIKKDRQ